MPVLQPNTSDIRNIATFVAELNRQPQHHVGYLGDAPDEIGQALNDLDRPIAGAFRIVNNDEQIVGVLGFEADETLARAWMYGPWIEHTDWHVVSDQLFTAVAPLVPAAVNNLEIFCNKDNTRCAAFAQRHNFAPHGEHVILRFPRAALAALPPTGAQDVAGYEQQMQALHDRVFPGTYYSGEQIIGRLNAERRVFVVVNDTTLLGYAYVEAKPAFGEGSIEFVGVDERARGKGVGARLMAAALQWLFSFRSMQAITLTTNADNTPALALYRRTGFQTLHTMQGWRRLRV
jgi:ribosomal protein S18 acetylase RimI-like enzyme